MSQLVQIVGSLLVLAGFALVQPGLLRQRSRTYLALNVVGSTVLEHQWGFLLLEGVWALVSATGLLSVLRDKVERSAPSVARS